MQVVFQYAARCSLLRIDYPLSPINHRMIGEDNVTEIVG